MDRNLSCDEMDSDDLDGDLNLSDEDSGAATRGQIREARRAAPQQEAEDREQYQVEFDTNVFKVKLDVLQERGQLATGDACFCKKCKGVFNSTSTLKTEGDKQFWVCEFCNERNEVELEPEEIPTSAELNYLLEAAA